MLFIFLLLFNIKHIYFTHKYLIQGAPVKQNILNFFRRENTAKTCSFQFLSLCQTETLCVLNQNAEKEMDVGRATPLNDSLHRW